MSSGPQGSMLSPSSLSTSSQPRRLVLTGFMGAGKSTVGRILAARLRWPFLDIDSLITAKHGQTIAGIFADHGEEHFRRLEAEAVAHALDPAPGREQAVLALGGGAIETEAVRRLLFAEAASAPVQSVPAVVTIFLSAPLPELLARCHIDPSAIQSNSASSREEAPVRPLLAAAAEPPADRLARRLPHYRRAHLTVDTAGVPPGEVVDRIVDWLRAVSFFPS